MNCFFRYHICIVIFTSNEVTTSNDKLQPKTFFNLNSMDVKTFGFKTRNVSNSIWIDSGNEENKQRVGDELLRHSILKTCSIIHPFSYEAFFKINENEDYLLRQTVDQLVYGFKPCPYIISTSRKYLCPVIWITFTLKMVILIRKYLCHSITFWFFRS